MKVMSFCNAVAASLAKLVMHFLPNNPQAPQYGEKLTAHQKRFTQRS
jgi:hypothetical protein